MTAAPIGVVGAGSWGTALAIHLARAGHLVRLWAREPEIVAGIRTNRRTPLYLSDVEGPRHRGLDGRHLTHRDDQVVAPLVEARRAEVDDARGDSFEALAAGRRPRG